MINPMTDNYQEIEANCYSELTPVSLGFSMEYNDSISELGTEWIYESVEESFWENSYEFEPYIKIAKNLVETDKTISYEDALKRVFGRFSISFYVNENPVQVYSDVDVNEQIYALLAYL